MLNAPALAAVPDPSTPLGPFLDSAVGWFAWATLFGFVGLLALALIGTGPVARRLGADVVAPVTTRLVRVALVFGVLAVFAALTDIAHDASESAGFAYGAAWDALYDGTNDGRLLGLEVTLTIVGIVLVGALALRPTATKPARPWLLGGGLLAGAVALGTTKFPDEVPENWGRTSFETLMWMLHLLGGAIWIGGLIGLVALAIPGAVPRSDRAAFWPASIRRFSVMAMACVGAIALSGLWLYWTHVDGPSQLFTTMYGRVLGVKILIFGTLLLLGMVNQFWLHPRIDVLRATGDDRPLRTILVRQFPVVVSVEVVLGLGVLLVAPFLHGSARNQAFQELAAGTAEPGTELARVAPKEVMASTWVYGIIETLLVVAVMIASFSVSGRISRRRLGNRAAFSPEPATP